jgi:hypothetical protein
VLDALGFNELAKRPIKHGKLAEDQPGLDLVHHDAVQRDRQCSLTQVAAQDGFSSNYRKRDDKTPQADRYIMLNDVCQVVCDEGHLMKSKQ